VEVRLLACTKLDLNYPLVPGLTELDSVVAHAISMCYRTTPSKNAILKCLKNGHTSVFEHISFTFDIEGISRVCLAQLTRHRIASYTVESQRFVDYTKKLVGVVVPPSISSPKCSGNGFDVTFHIFNDVTKEAFRAYEELVSNGVKPEDARFILPQATTTNLVMTINARSLFNFFNQRLDKRAQWEIRELAQRMLRIVKELAPITFSQYRETGGDRKGADN